MVEYIVSGAFSLDDLLRVRQCMVPSPVPN